MTPIDELEKLGDGALVAVPILYRPLVGVFFKALMKALRYLDKKGGA